MCSQEYLTVGNWTELAIVIMDNSPTDCFVLTVLRLIRKMSKKL